MHKTSLSDTQNPDRACTFHHELQPVVTPLLGAAEEKPMVESCKESSRGFSPPSKFMLSLRVQ